MSRRYYRDEKEREVGACAGADLKQIKWQCRTGVPIDLIPVPLGDVIRSAIHRVDRNSFKLLYAFFATGLKMAMSLMHIVVPITLCDWLHLE